MSDSSQARLEPSALTVISRAEAREMGLTKYFTGAPCPHGHAAERWTSSCCCLSCCAIKGRKWKKDNRDLVCSRRRAQYADNPEKFRSIRTTGYWKNPEISRRIAASYRLANPEKVKAVANAYWKRNPDKRRANKALWDAANKTRTSEYSREWRKSNPEKERSKQRNRRARIAAADGKHSAADIAWLWSVQRGRCAHSWCRAKLTKRCFARGRRADPVDHIIPLANGGTNDRKNLQILCLHCNASKGAKHPLVFALQHGMLV